MPRPVTVTYSTWPTPAQVAAAAAQLFLDTAHHAVATRGIARIAISGGTTPKAMFALLADPSQPFRNAVDWQKLQLFWVDERCVPPTDPESNIPKTSHPHLSKVPLHPSGYGRSHRARPPEEAASRYESTLRNTLKLEGAESPAFDLLLLGMGDDGHTASLFPHTGALHELGRLVVANHVPQKDTWRITLTWPVINQAREVAFLLEGEGKASVLAEVLTGPHDPERLPSQLIRPSNGKLRFLLDDAAASRLPAPSNTLTATGGSHRVGTLEL
ncbi:MAG: 6-phosphogluconolactonase [Acidobacteriaceae bacterium]